MTEELSEMSQKHMSEMSQTLTSAADAMIPKAWSQRSGAIYIICSGDGGGEVGAHSKCELVAPVYATTVIPLLEVAMLLAYPDGCPAPDALNLA